MAWENPEASRQAAGEWVKSSTPEGDAYWYHTATMESSWTDPNAAGDPDWASGYTPEGYQYWYNTKTGETSWDPH